MSWLASGLPGTIAVSPDSAGFTACSRMSSRSLLSRFFSSGPWQAKHLSERIGRTSRLKLTVAFCSARTGAGSAAQSRSEIEIRRFMEVARPRKISRRPVFHHLTLAGRSSAALAGTAKPPGLLGCRRRTTYFSPAPPFGMIPLLSNFSTFGRTTA